MPENTVRALRVSPRGELAEVSLPEDTRAQLAAMYRQMDCALVEPVSLSESLTMWCDEEGFLTARPEVNLCATGVAARRGITHQPYAGTVLFTGAADAAGRIRELSRDQALELRRECEHVIRLTVTQRMADPGAVPRDEVRSIHHESGPGFGGVAW